jgi:hypothetical protein
MLTTLLTWIMAAPKMAGGWVWQCEVEFPGEAVFGAKALGPRQNRICIDFRHLPGSQFPLKHMGMERTMRTSSFKLGTVYGSVAA